jgi:hypothetical protein
MEIIAIRWISIVTGTKNPGTRRLEWIWSFSLGLICLVDTDIDMGYAPFFEIGVSDGYE